MIHSIPWYIVILVSVPETFLALLISFKIYDISVPVKEIFIVAVINGIAAYFVRMLPLYYGFHTLALVIIVAVVIYLRLSMNIIHSLIVIFTGIILIGIAQAIYSPMLFMFASLDTGDIVANPMLNFYFFLPSAVLMLILYCAVKKFNFILYDLKQ